MSEVTRILGAIQAGQSQAAEELLPLVYNELRQLAAAKLAREAPGQTLQATALVHEAWLRVSGSDEHGWQVAGHSSVEVARAGQRQRYRSGERLVLNEAP